ncbi:vasoactive intestinal polypeptide receptor-like [Chiloscyllium plagiosum]|uniref:vasoactive intestinal polypeptide receptor-like n=1 Tax=Chiloscyllium plagiosum TaxID=36176 RepID=UPI001CB7DC37|nr:vasoactive intestinal polypeptide receptor-like [Chiloscyllium plagiosum]
MLNTVEFILKMLFVCIFIKEAFYMKLKIIYTVGNSISFIFLFTAVTILSLFRKLHCTRNYIHMHLFVSYILRAISIFIKDNVLFSSEDKRHCTIYPVECKVAIVFFQYCVLANFNWLLIEALYLHTLLAVSAFSEQKYFRWYIILGWGKFYFEKLNLIFLYNSKSSILRKRPSFFPSSNSLIFPFFCCFCFTFFIFRCTSSFYHTLVNYKTDI